MVPMNLFDSGVYGSLWGKKLPFFGLQVLAVVLVLTVSDAEMGHAQTGDATAEELSLRDAIQLAIFHNPAIHEASSRTEMAAEHVVQARSGFWPQLDLTGEYQRTTNPALAFSTKLNQEVISEQDFDPDRLNDPDPADNFSGGLTAVWSIYDSGRTLHGTRQAEQLREVSDLSLERTRRQVVAQAIISYAGLLTAGEQLEILRQTRETAVASLRRVQSRYRSGFVVKSDLLQTQVHLAAIEQQFFEAESRVEIARAQLNDTLGVAIDRRFELVDTLIIGHSIDDPLERWIRTAIERRADLKAADQRCAVAETEVEKMRAAYLPSLNLTGNYQLNTERFDESADNYSVGAYVSLNLFSGHATSSRVRESLAALRAAQAARKRLEQQIRVEIRQAYLQAQSAWKRIAVARQSMEQAAEALRIVSSRYESGLLTIVDQLTAELALQQAETRHLHALHDYQVARAHLMLAAGTLDESFPVGAEINGEPQ